MPSKYPILTPDEVIKGLKAFGFVFISQRGSHCKYRKDSLTVIIPMHSEIAKGTLKSILQQANLELEELLSVI